MVLAIQEVNLSQLITIQSHFLQEVNYFFFLNLFNLDSLCLWNIDTNYKEYIHSQKNGFQTFATNSKKNLIAIAEYGLNPIVYIYKDKKLVQQIKGVCQLEIIQMDISPNGQYLLVVTGVPSYEISIWNIETASKIEGNESKLPLKLNFVNAFFCQHESNQFYLVYEKYIQLYAMIPSYEKADEEVVKQTKLDQKKQLFITIDFLVQDYLSDIDTGASYQNNLYLVQGNLLQYVNGEIFEEITRHEMQCKITQLLVTQKHIIVVDENNCFQILFKYIPINIKDDQRTPFKLDKTYQCPMPNVSHLLYNHHYTKIIAGLIDSSILILPIPAESSQEDDDYDPGDKQDNVEDQVEVQEVKQLEIEPTKLGDYQTGSLNFIREFNSVHVLVTGCLSGKILFWDIIKRDVICSFTIKGKITTGEIQNNDQTLVIGTELGVIRFFNIANIRKPVLTKVIKIYNKKPITCLTYNPDNSIIAVSSVDSPKIYFLNAAQQMIIGYSELPINCNYITWNHSSKQILNSAGAAMLFAVTSFLLISIIPPELNQQYQSLKLSNDISPQYGRKIDPDQIIIVINSQGEILTTGKDKVFKKYKQPEEQLSKMDLKMKVASQGPMDEQDGHQLTATCFAINNKQNILYSGAQDGTVMLRSSERLAQEVQSFNAHSLKMGGVTALEISHKTKLLYTGGKDGDMFWWTNSKLKFEESDAEKVMKNVFDVPESVEDQQDEEVKHYQQVLEEEYMESQAPIREQQKKEKKELLQSIKDQLNELIEQNNNAEELEQLSRDEFVIDTMTREKILEQGRKQKEQLRDKVKKENYRQEILHKLIKERTWDQMDNHLRAINGLNSNIIVSNFHVRKRGQAELRKLELIKELRKQELKEKQQRKDKNSSEIWQIEDHMTDPKAYIVNANNSGPQQMVLTDYEKKEEPVQQPGKPGQKGAVAERGKPGARIAGKNVRQQQQESKKEEEKEEEVKKEVQKVEEKKEGEDFNEWEYLYGAFELFTENRKRNQIIMIENVIFKIKDTFNNEFEKMMSQRQNQVDNIQERNKRIAEILTELHKPLDLFQCKKNILENPETVLDVKVSEIPFERFLTREERERREQERLKEEERLRLLMEDDSGIRAVKDMMGGTLEEKKETPLDEKLEEEEWMKKPFEDMTEEERMKLKEFEVKKARLEEEKEKIRKNLENELKKLKNEILELCVRFDERLLILFRRKLEFDYRIFEQELQIVRLALSIMMQKEAQVKIRDLQNLLEELELKAQDGMEMKGELEEIKKQIEAQKQKVQEQLVSIQNQRPQHIPGFDAGKIRNVWMQTFEETRKDDRKKKLEDKRLLEDPNNSDILITIDPLFELQKRLLKAYNDTIFETYLPDIQEKVQNLQFFDWNDQVSKDFTLNNLRNRFLCKKEIEKYEQDLKDIETFSLNYKDYLDQLQKNQETSTEDFRNINQMIEKSKSNIEIILRFKQGFVEISQDKPVPALTEAIVIPREAIDKKNEEINKQGQKKIQLMEAVKEIKFAVAKSEYELKSSDLIIKDLECKTREVQLLKVKKEMYAALKKKDTRLNEQELTNLQNQIDMLKQATDKRIQIYQKKEEKIRKDIEFIQKENEQLVNQGTNLNSSVKQLQEISDMTFKKKSKQGQEDNADTAALDKFKQITTNRKYFDLAKKQTEEIDLLREELNKLKARTFANFSNVNNR